MIMNQQYISKSVFLICFAKNHVVLVKLIGSRRIGNFERIKWNGTKIQSLSKYFAEKPL